MNDENVVDIESTQPRRRQGGVRSATQPKKAELSDIAAADVLTLGACIANSIISGLEVKERKRVRRILLFIASGVVILVGMLSLAVQLIRN
jgi:hypothetical protein